MTKYRKHSIADTLVERICKKSISIDMEDQQTVFKFADGSVIIIVEQYD